MLALPAPLRAAIEARGSGLSILVLRLGAMGDVVRTLPAVRLVKAGLPEARIHWVVWEPWTPLLTGHADLDTVIGLPRSTLRSAARSPLRWPSLVRGLGRIGSRIRALDAGLALDFHGDLRSGVLGVVSGAPVRLGYAGHQQKEGNRLFTTVRVPSGDRRTPRLQRNLELASALGVPVSPVPDAGIPIPRADEEAARAVVSACAEDGAPYAVLNPGASLRQSYKKPPPSLFAGAARALAARAICPIVVGGPGEDADVDRVLEASRGTARRAPRTSLLTLAALLREARLFVGGDSGPLHLACGVSCPVVGLYGPTDPIVNAPWNVPFAALTRPGSTHTGIKREDRRLSGFDGLAPEAVATAVERVLDRPRVPSPAP